MYRRSNGSTSLGGTALAWVGAAGPWGGDGGNSDSSEVAGGIGIGGGKAQEEAREEVRGVQGARECVGEGKRHERHERMHGRHRRCGAQESKEAQVEMQEKVQEM
jgi:hypothetical protein